MVVAYMSSAELSEFLSSTADSISGFAYEWEGEGVVHFRTHPLRHGFGKQSLCRFERMDTPISAPSGETIWRVAVSLSNGEPVAVILHADGTKCDVVVGYIPEASELYSRSKGLLEVGALSGKRVMIVGLGSFGAQIAVELAKAGVGSFSLWDYDRVELHNLVRHICDVNDLGRMKTDAVRDAVLGKNPYATVDLFPFNINEETSRACAEVARADLLICATDNNLSRFNLSRAAIEHSKVCIFGRAVTRAAGGDVFRYRPGGPCYGCLIGNGVIDSRSEELKDVRSARANGRIPAYVSESDATATVQVGLSSDIEPICNLMVKLSLLELSHGCETGIQSLEEDLVYDYYLWANRREYRHAAWSAFPRAGNKPTVMRWYGARIERESRCALCGIPILDDGGDVSTGGTPFQNDLQVDLDCAPIRRETDDAC